MHTLLSCSRALAPDHRCLLVGLGIDTASTDRGQSRQFRTHRLLGGQNVWGLENLARTAELPATGFTVYNLVHKLGGGSGGPSRVVAVLKTQTATAASTNLPCKASLLVLLILWTIY